MYQRVSCGTKCVYIFFPFIDKCVVYRFVLEVCKSCLEDECYIKMEVNIIVNHLHFCPIFFIKIIFKFNFL